MTQIDKGDRLPEATLRVMGSDGPETHTSTELLGKGKVVLFGVPGAFTPTCSASHLPGFIEHADALRKAGVERIACLCVQDAFVMDAWGKAAGAGSDITMVADGNGELTRAMGLEFDGTAFGMGHRCARFAMIIEDGVVQEALIEQGGEFRVSGAEQVLARL